MFVSLHYHLSGTWEMFNHLVFTQLSPDLANVNHCMKKCVNPIDTLAKWKKLEPNEIIFSQGFSLKVVVDTTFRLKLFGHWGRLLLSADNICKQFGPRSGPTKCRA